MLFIELRLTRRKELCHKTTKKSEEKERFRLINELGDKLTQAQILFADVKKLRKIKKEVSAKPLLDREDIINDSSLSKEEKLRKINQRKLEADAKIDLDARFEKAKLYGLAAAELGLGMFPATRAMNFGGKIARQAFKKYLGRRVSESIGKGAAAGAVSGGIDNTIEGIKEKKNPIVEGVKGSLKGAVTGATTTGAGAKAEKIIRAKILSSKGDIKAASPEKRRAFRKEAQGYYKDYIQDTSVKNPDIGEVKFSAKGMEETVSKNPNLAKDFPDLKKDVKNARLTETNGLYKNRKDNTKEFYTLEGDKQHLIAKNRDGNKYYLSKNKMGNDSGLLPSGGGFMSSPNNSIAQQPQSFNFMESFANKFKNLFFKR